MPSFSGRLCQQVGLACSVLLVADRVALAQSLVAEPGATETQVQQSANQFEITGGIRSADGANLFHSFRQFGLTAGQVANFISPAEVSNIIGRVSGGQASYIDGLLQVSGSQANLFLLNPAGILLGSEARLNLGGDFTATTATGLSIGDRTFSALGENNYAALVGEPTGFIFDGANPGAIANAGNLAVATGRSLSLIGGAVANTGTLTASEGSLLVAAVPGESWVRISHPQMLLSLEVTPLATTNSVVTPTFQPLALPALLTGAGAAGATGLSVNADGSVSLVSQPGAIAATTGTTLVAGRLDAVGATGGQIAVVGDRVAVLNSTLDVSGDKGGGTLRVGGDYLGQGRLPSATQTYISANARLLANAGLQGRGGQVIVWADETAQFSGAIAANGGSQAGDGGLVEVSGKNQLVFRGTVETAAANGTAGTLLLDPDTLTIVDTADGTGSLDDELTPGADDDLLAAVPNDGANTISVGQLAAFGGNAQIVLQANNGITIADLASDLLHLNIAGVANGSITFIADADNDGVGNFSMNPSDTIRTNGGAVIIRGVDIRVGDIQTDFGAPTGNVDIRGASLRIGRIDSGDVTVDGGRIELVATAGNIVVDSLEAGPGGLRVEAAGLFQAISSDLEFFNAPSGSDLGSVPVSVLVRSTATTPGQLVILHNGVTTATLNEQIVIDGNGAAFVFGPTINNPSDPGQLGASASYTPLVFDSADFPTTVSGTVGAIAIGAGSDATLVTSLQNQPFVPEPEPSFTGFDTASLDQLEREQDSPVAASRSVDAALEPQETTDETTCTAQQLVTNAEGLPELRAACPEGEASEEAAGSE
ncbi:two-partner secretion domain-containing protein [Almyronema epifaneia]|uniref:Filamentous hemagglutinin N-terminal domain-containing protein n=1 Tax=Almyronema epifaneia S1 TaxID=2991925 RepID=A0ABW6I9V7_9CYAN